MKFMEKLSDKKSLEIVKNIQKFVHLDFKLVQNKPKTEISKVYQDFLTQQIGLFMKIWGVECDSDGYHEVCDGLEKNLTINLYNKLFSSSAMEIEEDYKFELHVESLKFLTFTNLDINKEAYNEIYMKLAVSNLQKINHFKSPKEKVNCIINYCIIITQMVYNLRRKPTGADEAYDFFVLGLLSNVKKLKSNLAYIESFRYERRFEGQEAYYFTTIQSVVSFIENITAKDVKMQEDEFIKKINEEKKKINIKKQQDNLNPIIKSKFFNKKTMMNLICFTF